MKQFLLLSIMSLFCLTVSAQNWIQLGNDINGEAAGDFCGSHSSLSADGNTVAVGALYNSDGGYRAGHVRVFALNGSNWTQKGSDIDGEGAEDNSSRVALSADGNTLAIGAPFNGDSGSNSGHVRVYYFDGSDWIKQGATIPSEGPHDQSGGAIGISADGSRVAIGSMSVGSTTGQVRVFGWDGSSWIKLGSNINGGAPGDQFGFSVKLSADGNTFVAGSPHADAGKNGNGVTSIYKYNGTEWIQKGVNIPGEQTNGNSGSSVDISADGSTIITSESQYVSQNGDKIGRVRMFSWNGSDWVQKGSNIDGTWDYDKIGSYVAMNNAGNIIAFRGLKGPQGSGSHGSARVFKYTDGDWVQLGQTIFGQSTGDDSGRGLDLNESGNTVSTGSITNNNNGQSAGQLRVFRYDGNLEITENTFSSISLYPNPTERNFEIDLGKEYTDVSIAVYNILGQLVSTEKYTSTKAISQEINASAGVYFVKVSTAKEGSKTFRIIKQ
ncbi:T9SS type A sorting domain-containing protein [Aequorivita sp. H23M31]|uniref:T9SS type A sorting domain-containing protein n=1 Tax=Aequorivita ciconiae TaxID=2494375 RepID=A0A410G5Z7_9FLAO|nr:T9SS type A sorting domain-containing protein [Aequorivita sp. H23M31]QAA82651.1 T9SS type A sorting domain-containing protein [Aequorivita sp. H23M31]